MHSHSYTNTLTQNTQKTQNDGKFNKKSIYLKQKSKHN